MTAMSPPNSTTLTESNKALDAVADVLLCRAAAHRQSFSGHSVLVLTRSLIAKVQPPARTPTFTPMPVLR